MAEKAIDLFQAYSQNKLPKEGGYIVSSFFMPSTTYAKYEIVAYNGVKSIYLSDEGLTFQTDGNKLFVLVEPPTYSRKFVEPVSRSSEEQIPHRFNELEIYTSKNQAKVMVSKRPIMAYSAFTILKPTGNNFSFLFYNLPDVLDTIEFFFTQTLNKDTGLSQSDAKKASKFVREGLMRFTIW
ncbi:MAG: hypothetical protein DRP87_01435 [Spirochaetes bacterium]|nr:MAG: hypothetical protein DRP87_01435 [Spirochaetota bacterium]